MMRRIWQGFLSVLALGGFFALEYLRGRDVDPLVLVICSWVAVAAPVLLAILWVSNRQYVRTFFLAVLVAATRVSLEDSLSDFMRIAAWFLIGAIGLVLIVALVARWLRKGSGTVPAVATAPATATAPAAATAPLSAPPVNGAARTPPVEPTPPKAVTGLEPVAPVTPVTYMNLARESEPGATSAERCEACGASIADAKAGFCTECGAKLT